MQKKRKIPDYYEEHQPVNRPPLKVFLLLLLFIFILCLPVVILVASLLHR